MLRVDLSTAIGSVADGFSPQNQAAQDGLKSYYKIY